MAATAPDTICRPEVTCPISRGRIETIVNDALATSAKLQDMQCEIIGEGKGFLSVITKVKLTWSDEGSDNGKLPQGIILKKPTLDRIKDVPVMKDFINDVEQLRRLHNRECDAYQFFNKYQPAPFQMARCFAAEKMSDSDPSKGLLILEDLGDIGRSLHFNEDATLEKTMAVVGHIANLQAYGFEHPDYQETIGEIPLNLLDGMFEGVHEAAADLRQKYPDRFDLSDERITELLDQARKDLEILLHPKKHGYTQVLCLGDVQPNNLLWKIKKDGTLSDDALAFLDFQLSHSGSCFYDIAMLTVMNVKPEIWAENEEKIFSHYLTVLKSKTTKNISITTEEMKTQCKLMAKIWGLGSLSMVSAADVMAEKAGLTRERIDEMMERVLHGVKELSI